MKLSHSLRGPHRSVTHVYPAGGVDPREIDRQTRVLIRVSDTQVDSSMYGKICVTQTS